MKITAGMLSQYAIFNDMLGACSAVSNFNPSVVAPFLGLTPFADKIIFTGEGSSRIFPAKNAIDAARRLQVDAHIFTEGGRKVAEYNLDESVVLLASNSGKTAEMGGLITVAGHDPAFLFGLTAYENTPVANLIGGAHLLSCGEEDAVAATKSVIEQALFMRAVVESLRNDNAHQQILDADRREMLATLMRQVLTADMDDFASKLIASASTVYFAGRNDGVAEELALKTKEIARKKAFYLEGTYVLHGAEEVMDESELVVIVEPFKEDMKKYDEVLRRGVGMNVIAIASEETIFPTVIVPELENLNGYLQMVTGWRLLLQAAHHQEINPDKPVRARKIGNSI